MSRTRVAAGWMQMVVVASAIAPIIAACSEDTSDPPALLSNAGMKELLSDQWKFTEDSISACMAEAGFDYFPKVFDEDKVAIPTGDDADARFLEFTLTVEEVEEKGFGVSTGLAHDLSSVGAPDRNAAYEASLSPSDYAAYQLALEGGGTGDGCRAEAETAAEEEFAAPVAELTESADFVRTFVMTSAEFERISAGWSTCMAERGWADADVTEFDTVTRDEAQRRLDRIAVDGTSGNEEAGPHAPEYPEDELSAVRQWETEAAVDYVECFGAFRADYGKLLDEAYSRLP
ncbi:hypothetical protein [Nocardioides stalactiti]|uniref:hypothetical protein n=1 Tax=Nocardioides stalactiti TaxID=2755356 RepID=UPI001602F25F|nr:hypothetical protein [Nocardioides stalactiti]